LPAVIEAAPHEAVRKLPSPVRYAPDAGTFSELAAKSLTS
jgi:hypothetical protein